VTAPTWLVKALAKHGEKYDSDCDVYSGCFCGWDNGTDEHNDGYDEHLAEVIATELRARLESDEMRARIQRAVHNAQDVTEPMDDTSIRDDALAAVTDELLGGSDADRG
jgi:hypothetical protein